MHKTQLDNLKQNAKKNTYSPHGDLREADCLIGFSFGYILSKSKIKPGTSNEQLARYIEKNFVGLPLILQYEINLAFKQRTAELVISKPRKQGAYLSSYELAQQAYNHMKKRGWTTAVIVTHSAMEARNVALCETLGIKTIAPGGLDKIEFDVKSAQKWTRNRVSWWNREEKVIDSYNSKGWL